MHRLWSWVLPRLRDRPAAAPLDATAAPPWWGRREALVRLPDPEYWINPLVVVLNALKAAEYGTAGPTFLRDVYDDTVATEAADEAPRVGGLALLDLAEGAGAVVEGQGEGAVDEGWRLRGPIDRQDVPLVLEKVAPTEES